jgi:hypothetical protein
VGKTFRTKPPGPSACELTLLALPFIWPFLVIKTVRMRKGKKK